MVPPFESALNGITVQRMMELLPGVRMGMEGWGDQAVGCWFVELGKLFGLNQRTARAGAAAGGESTALGSPHLGSTHRMAAGAVLS